MSRTALTIALLVLLLPASARAEGGTITVVAADPEVAEAKVRSLAGDQPVDLLALPDELEVAGLWLIGAAPTGLCPTPSLTADEVRSALEDAQRRIDEVEVEEAQARLSALRNRLGCLDSPADPEALWSLHFLEAVTAHFASGADDARPALERALAVRPGAAYDESYPPDLREAYLQAQQEVMGAGWARVLAPGLRGGQAVLVDGAEVPPGGLELIPGEHLVQLRSPDGVLRGGSLVLEVGDVLVVGSPKGLSRALATLDREQQDRLRAWLAVRLGLAEDARVWIADAGRALVALGEGTGLARPARPAGRAPLFQLAVGGGYQRIGGWDYGLFAADASILLVGPLRLQVHVRPAVGRGSELLPGEVPVVVPFGLGPLLRLPGPVHLRAGALFELVVDRNEGPVGETRVLAGVVGSVGADIPLPDAPLAIRPTFEAGFLGPDPWPVLRGQVALVLELGGER